MTQTHPANGPKGPEPLREPIHRLGASVRWRRVTAHQISRGRHAARDATYGMLSSARSFRRVLGWATVLSLTAAAAAAQQHHTVSGVVLDSTGTPITGVAVALRDSSGAVQRGVADESGRFSLEPV